MILHGRMTGCQWATSGANSRLPAGPGQHRVRPLCRSPATPAPPAYNRGVYIVAIAWLYVVVLMAATETSAVAALLTFVFYGLAPLALFLWLVGTPARRRRAARTEAAEPDAKNPVADDSPGP